MDYFSIVHITCISNLVCDELSTHGIVTFIFTCFGMGITTLFPIVMAEAFIRHGAYAHCSCGTHLSTNVKIFVGILTPIFYTAFIPVAMPNILACSLNSFNVVSIIATLTFTNITGIVEFGVVALLISSWMKGLLSKCKAQTSEDQTSRLSYAGLEDVLSQYESFRFSTDRFVFFMFASAQIVAIMAFYIATNGKLQVRQPDR